MFGVLKQAHVHAFLAFSTGLQRQQRLARTAKGLHCCMRSIRGWAQSGFFARQCGSLDD